MKFKVVLKDPIGVIDSIEDAVADVYKDNPDLSNDENNDLFDKNVLNLREFVNHWVVCGDYVVLEFDTEANTAIVERSNDSIRE